MERRRPSETPRLAWLSALPNLLRTFLNDERGQDTFEYILVAGTVAIAIVGILILAFEEIIPGLVGTSCSSVDPLGSVNAGDCIGN